MIFKNIQIPIKWFLTIIFFIGGILQYLQILSVTQTNILLLFIIATTSGAKFKKNDFNDLVLFALLAHVFIVFLINKSTLVSFFAYIYFLMCIFLSRWFTIQVVNFYPKIFNTDLYLKIGLSLLIIQIPILVLQNIFGEFIGAHAPISEQAVVGEVFGTDMAYGTLFFKSDSTLTAIATLFFISTFALNASFKFRFNVFLTSLLIVFLCNSIAFRYLLISIGVFLFVFSSKEKFGIYKPLFIGLFIITTTIIFIYFKEISKIYFEILDEITYWYLFRSD